MTSDAMRQRPRAFTSLALASTLITLASLIPVVSVLQPGSWMLLVFIAVLAITATGFIARALTWLPRFLVPLAQLVVVAAVIVASTSQGTALAAVIPTPATFGVWERASVSAMEELRLGVAPLVPSSGLVFLLVVAAAALALAIDLYVCAARVPVIAVLFAVAVFIAPILIVRDVWSIPAFVALAAAIVFLFAADTRVRRILSGAPSRSWRGRTATAIAAAAAVVAAIIVAPMIPYSVPEGSLAGGGATIDTTLNLGDDLRQPTSAEVLTVTSSSGVAPYLRLATLTEFNGNVWVPDSPQRLATVPFSDLPGPESNAEIATVEITSHVQIGALATSRVPLPFPATSVTGLDGDDWTAILYNRTGVRDAQSVAEAEYTAVATVPRPTLEQIRAATTPVPDGDTSTVDLPLGDDFEASISRIAALAADVTADADTPYDRLVTLQDWFRSDEFRYSLDAPVDDGFDGSDLDAIEAFLQVRSGYCIHFASAFALMARTLDIPTRVVTGFLPGTATAQRVDGDPEFSVSTRDLHAWPEAYFEGIGWVPFEPTASLGTPTSFTATATQTTAPTASAEPTTAPSPSATSSRGPNEGTDSTDQRNPVGATARVNLTGVVIALVVLVLLALPRILRSVLRRRRGRGSAVAVWQDTVNEAVDLFVLPLDTALSPRESGERMIAAGADRVDVEALVMLVENAAYARDANEAGGTELASQVTSALRRSTPVPTRVVAFLFPRSLARRG